MLENAGKGLSLSSNIRTQMLNALRQPIGINDTGDLADFFTTVLYSRNQAGGGKW